MPADHLINQEAVFRQVVSVGAQLADRQNVTFGIVPTGPETGYGYIRKGTLADEEALAGSMRLSKNRI